MVSDSGILPGFRRQSAGQGNFNRYDDMVSFRPASLPILEISHRLGFINGTFQRESPQNEITGHPKKVSAELIICFLLDFIVVLFKHGA